MNRKTFAAFACGLAFLWPFTAHANSSWIWISQTRPADVLPWAAGATVLCEWLLLLRFAGIGRRVKALGIVAAANAVSFAVPYAFSLFTFGIDGLAFPEYLDHWPSYTVGAAFAAATLVFELPVVYFGLRGDAPERKRLVWTTIASNILTTAFVAVVERLLCRGRW